MYFWRKIFQGGGNSRAPPSAIQVWRNSRARALLFGGLAQFSMAYCGTILCNELQQSMTWSGILQREAQACKSAYVVSRFFSSAPLPQRTPLLCFRGLFDAANLTDAGRKGQQRRQSRQQGGSRGAGPTEGESANGWEGTQGHGLWCKSKGSLAPEPQAFNLLAVGLFVSPFLRWRHQGRS